MMFRIGQKVVCVDAEHNNDRLVENTIYTVSATHMQRDSRGAYGVEVAEVPAPVCWLGRGFSSLRFRPVVEKSTDAGMAVLRKILDRESFDEKKPAKVRG